MTKRTKLAIYLSIVAVLAFAVGIGVGALLSMNRQQCVDIIGDGYAMGTDPEPIVIGNTCDQ